MTKTRTHSFVLVLDGPHEPSPGLEDGLFEAGCDDAILVFRGTTPFLEFDRAAETLEEAILSAIENVENAGLQLAVVRVEPDDLVNASEIGRRAGTTRETVRLWFEGT